MTDIAKLVGENAEHLWDYLPNKKIYYKDSAPWGIIGTFYDDGVTVIFSMANDNMFTRGMLRDIMKLYNQLDIALVSDVESKFDYIKGLLDPYDFTYRIVDAEHIGRKIMYAFHFIGDKQDELEQ